MAFTPPYHLAYKSADQGSGNCFVTTLNLGKNLLKSLKKVHIYSRITDVSTCLVLFRCVEQPCSGGSLKKYFCLLEFLNLGLLEEVI